MPKNKSIAKNSIFNIAYTLSNQIFPLITSIYVSRILMSSGVGKVSYAQNIASYFATLSMLGLPTYGIREIAKVTNDKEKTNEVFTQLIVINAISTSIASIAYVALILGVPDFRNELNLYIACGLSIFFNYINVDWFYQGKEEYGYITIRSIVIKIIALLLLISFVHERSDYAIYAWISSLATGGNYIFNVVHARKYVRLSFKNFKLQPHIRPLMYLAVALFLGSIYSKIDTTMLGIMTGDNNVGYYTYAYKIINAVVSGCTAITTVFLPRLSYEYANNRRKFNEYINFGTKVLSFLVFPITIGVFMLAQNIVILFFGADFLPAAKTIRFFCPIIIIKSFGDLLCYQTIISTGNEKQRIVASAWGSVVNIILNYILIQAIAQDGAAIASVISELIYNSYLFFKVKKLIKFHGNKKAIGQALISTAIMAIAIYIIKLFELGSGLTCLLSIVIGIAVYFEINKLFHNEIYVMAISRLKTKIS